MDDLHGSAQAGTDKSAGRVEGCSCQSLPGRTVFSLTTMSLASSDQPGMLGSSSDTVVFSTCTHTGQTVMVAQHTSFAPVVAVLMRCLASVLQHGTAGMCLVFWLLCRSSHAHQHTHRFGQLECSAYTAG